MKSVDYVVHSIMELICAHIMYMSRSRSILWMPIIPGSALTPIQTLTSRGGGVNPNFSWTNNQAPIQNTMPNLMSNNVEQFNQSRIPTLEETLNTFIQFSMDNHERHDKRLDLLEASMKRVEIQVAQIAEELKEHQKGSFQANLCRQWPSQSTRIASRMKIEWRRFLKIICHSTPFWYKGWRNKRSERRRNYCSTHTIWDRQGKGITVLT